MLKKLIGAAFGILGALAVAIPAGHATESYSSSNRVPAAIYLMWMYDTDGDYVYSKPFYVGQARRPGKTADKAAQARVNEHLKEKKFTDLLTNGDQWAWNIISSSEAGPTTDATGWTYLETSLNEQAFITSFCEEMAITANPRLLNSRNQISSGDLGGSNWADSKSKLSNLVPGAKNVTGTAPKAITNPGSCFTK